MDSNRTDDDLQARFEDQADDLDLTPEDEKAGWGEERTVGKAFGMHTVVDATPDKSHQGLDDDDRRQIEDLVRRYARCHPDEFLEQWRSMATDPFVVFGFGYVVEADEDTLRAWSERDVESATGSHFHDPRRVEVSKLQILDLGIARAGVTYHLSEELTDGTSTSGHQMAILMRLRGDEAAGWKIVGVTKSQHSVDEMKDMETYETQYKGRGSDD